MKPQQHNGHNDEFVSLPREMIHRLPHLPSAGRFTDLPSNMTVKEGQNIEMACAFQSGTPSVYLEIQWWFLKAPEPTDTEEEVDAEEVTRDLSF